jgi:tRNA 2-thiouridine synthesizing protein B
MPILHIINQSPSNSSTWRNMLRLINKHDSLILIEDACYACVQESSIQQLNALIEQHSIGIYVLESDHTARGLPNHTPWKEVNYQGFVSLVADTDKTISWCSE